MKLYRHHLGLTLVELLFVLAVVSIIALGAASMPALFSTKTKAAAYFKVLASDLRFARFASDSCYHVEVKPNGGWDDGYQVVLRQRYKDEDNQKDPVCDPARVGEVIADQPAANIRWEIRGTGSLAESVLFQDTLVRYPLPVTCERLQMVEPGTDEVAAEIQLWGSGLPQMKKLFHKDWVVSDCVTS